jgi:hypothetical protein
MLIEGAAEQHRAVRPDQLFHRKPLSLFTL